MRLAGRFVGYARKRALPRLGARDLLAQDLDIDSRAFADIRGAAREQIFLALVVPSDRVASAGDQAGGDDRPGRRRSVERNPRLDDASVLDQRRAGFPDAALDQPLRQSDNPPT